MPDKRYAGEPDLYLSEETLLTPEVLDRYPVVSATIGDRSYVALRSDKPIGQMYHRNDEPEPPSLPTLWVIVPDYGEATIARVQLLVEQSDARRIADGCEDNSRKRESSC